MERLSGIQFAALLAHADVSQAAFARLTGVTTRQVNKWYRGHAAVPVWAGIFAAALQDQSPAALEILVQEAQRALGAPEPPRDQ